MSTARNTVAILGVPFDNVTMDETVEIIESGIADRGFHQVATANVDFLIHAIHDKELQDILCNCDLVVPDGMPIVWAARMMGTILKERVSGVDLVPRLAELSARRGYRIFFLGASEKSSQRAAEVLTRNYPGLKLVGRYSPPLAPLAEMDHEDILRRIEEARPDILLVALGSPKQEKWLSMHRDRLRVPICIGVGGSLDMIGGLISRAPRWMQNNGLEWLYRACQEPQRLAQRYMNDAVGLAVHLPPQLAATAVQTRKPSHSSVQYSLHGNTRVVSVLGDLAGDVLKDFDRQTCSARDMGMNIVLDLSQTSYLGPDSLGSLIHLMTSMKQRSQQLWLADVRPQVARVLRAARLDGYFSITPNLHDALYRASKAEYSRFNEENAGWGYGHAANDPIRVRVEVLQDVCQQIVGAHQ